ncbi:putative reverse transcriptase domain-containing protein [Tanacetum coccineum]
MGIQITRRSSRRGNPGGTGNDGDAQPTNIHVWLERFRKEKPQTFSSASTPVEAKNWIAHIEKIFKVLGYDDQFKARLTTYKLEGDAHSWWRAYKQAKGGDAYVATLILNTEFTDVAQGSNKRVDDRRDIDRYGNRGRHGNRDRYDTDRWRGDRQGSVRHGNGSDRQGNGSQKAWLDQDQQVCGQHYSRSYGSSSQRGYSDYNSCPPCNLCGKFHPGKECHRATSACFECGEVGHLAKDCKKGSMSSGGKRLGTFPFKIRL